MTATPAVEGSGELVLYLGLGQSLLALVPRLRPLGETPGPVDATRAWVFAANGDPRVAVDPTQDLPEGTLAEVHPHLRHGRSGPLASASAAILGGLGAQDRLLTVNLARRNTRLDAFLPPGAAFRNVEACLRRASELAGEQGLRFERLVVSWVQGQADARTPHRLYLERLGELVDALALAMAAVSGDRGQLVFCLSQTTATYVPGRRGVPLAQLELAEARPGQVILAGPEYMLERSDGVHLKPRGAVRLGALHGRAIRLALVGAGWQPLRMVDAVVAGRDVRVRFAGGAGDLAAACAEPGRGEAGIGEAGPVEVGVRKLPHLGFVWQPQRGEDIGIVEARITGPREVVLTLSAAPQALDKARLVLGFPEGIGVPEGFVDGDPATAQGAATGLRTTGDSPGPFAEPLQDWALQQRIAPRWADLA